MDFLWCLVPVWHGSAFVRLGDHLHGVPLANSEALLRITAATSACFPLRFQPNRTCTSFCLPSWSDLPDSENSICRKRKKVGLVLRTIFQVELPLCGEVNYLFDWGGLREKCFSQCFRIAFPSLRNFFLLTVGKKISHCKKLHLRNRCVNLTLQKSFQRQEGG